MNTATDVTITLNGETRTVPPDTTVSQVIDQLGLNPRYVAVEVNLDLVPRTSHADQRLHEGDRLEIVTLVGGG
ncbi:MAG: sulfur carrier protein ThiS [Planctomycetota bacterium]|nr:sulfur carrier protein ThiS [Planctomycetota bacterium]